VLLLRAIGDLQQQNDGLPLDDMETIAAAVGIDGLPLLILIGTGLRAGYIEAGRDGEMMLTAKGQRWYKRDLERRK
jgi:hypothetical protein